MGKKELTMLEMVISAIKSGYPERGIYWIRLVRHILDNNKVGGYHGVRGINRRKKLYAREKDELTKVMKDGLESGKISFDGGCYKIAK